MPNSSALFRLLGLAVPASPENKTITGQLIDVGSYADGRPASDYAGLHARALSLEGFDIGVLTGDGKVYHITGSYHAQNNAKLFPLMLAKSVTVTGEVTEKDGQLWIDATDVK